MKVILTLLFVLFFGAMSVAQDNKVELKPKGVQTEIVIQNTDVKTAEVIKVITIQNDNSIARLYRYKNSRIKKALAFTTKRNKAKLA